MAVMTSPGGTRVLVLVGPTASGKTEVALHLAALLGGEIISADSRQVYKFLDIGTAKPAAGERRRIPHHFIDLLQPGEDFNAGRFGEEGRRVIDEVTRRGSVPIVVGGSGLYVQSLIDGFFDGPGADPDIRESLRARLAQDGVASLMNELHRVDPATAAVIDPTKPRRVVRALEVFLTTGQPLSWRQKEGRISIMFTPVLFGLLWDRKLLYERIDRRCERMIGDGLVEEADRLERMGLSPLFNALNTVGYREAFAFLHGEIDREEMIRLFQRNSRRYAKRQMTWFRRDARITWIPMDGLTTPEAAADLIAHDFTACAIDERGPIPSGDPS